MVLAGVSSLGNHLFFSDVSYFVCLFENDFNHYPHVESLHERYCFGVFVLAKYLRIRLFFFSLFCLLNIFVHLQIVTYDRF